MKAKASGLLAVIAGLIMLAMPINALARDGGWRGHHDRGNHYGWFKHHDRDGGWYGGDRWRHHHHDYDNNWYGPYGYGRWDGYWYRHHRYPAVYRGYPGGLVCDYDGDDCRPAAPFAVPFSSVYPY